MSRYPLLYCLENIDPSRQIIPKKPGNDPNSIKMIFSWDIWYIIRSKIDELIDI